MNPIDHYLKPLLGVSSSNGSDGRRMRFLAELLARILELVALPIAHSAPKAKSVIYFHLVGAPSHPDLYDYKPELQKPRELCPKEMFEGNNLPSSVHARLCSEHRKIRIQFRSCGQSGIQISDLLPNLQTRADEMCFIRTLHTDQFNHAPAQMFMQTGLERFGRPAPGAWTNYGLGSMNKGSARFRGPW